MADRVELNAENLESIVGGAFNYYYNDDGTMTCHVDNVGTYNCSSSAKDMISVYILQHDTCTLDEVVNYAVSQGLFW